MINRDSLERYMGELLWEKPNKIHVMRCKGVFISLNDDS